VLMPHVKRPAIDLFIDALGKIVKRLK
jgi:hypothetical protein